MNLYRRHKVTITHIFVSLSFTIIGWIISQRTLCSSIQENKKTCMNSIFGSRRSGSSMINTESLERKLVLVAVMTSAKFVNTRIPVIMDTWFKDIPGKVIFYSSEKTVAKRNIPLVRLKGVTDIYPPQKKSFLMMKHLYDNFGNNYEWFMRVDDDMYIKADKLQNFLSSMDSRNAYFIGQPGMGILSEKGKIGLGPRDNFCMGGPGMIISKTTLQRFVPHISECLLDLRSLHEDVEIGRCIRKFANVSCTWNYEMLHLLYNNPKGTDGFRQELQTEKVARAINLHPIKDAKLFYQVHYTLLNQRLRQNQQRLWEMQRDLARLNYGDMFKENNMQLNSFQCDKCIWTYLTSGSQYSTIDGQPVRSLQAVHREAINTIIDYYTYKLNMDSRKLGRYVDNMSIQNGYTTFKEDTGFLYILDITYKHHRYVKKKSTKLVRKHISVVFPVFSKWHIESMTRLERSRQVNFIVPCYGRHTMLRKFLSSFRDAFFVKGQKTRFVTLTVVASSADTPDVVGILNDAKKELPMKIVWTSNKFNRAKYRTLGADQFSSCDLLFFIDLDMVISEILLERIQQSVVKGIQVYMPIVFSQNEYSFWRLDDENINSSCNDNDMCINEDKGFWRYYGFGMIGIYKSDLDLVGGWDTSIDGWGKEDVYLIEALIKANITVFRPPDPSLVHIYHPKECNKDDLPIDQYKMCIGTQSLTAASYRVAASFARKIITHHFNVNQTKNKTDYYLNLSKVVRLYTNNDSSNG
ncbi:hypothetical protein GJ496_006570 [Pomphorhynchus laevis]|nr:hypothetical protein GJ496_006570 [Pomphorhynchus laevis]